MRFWHQNHVPYKASLLEVLKMGLGYEVLTSKSHTLQSQPPGGSNKWDQDMRFWHQNSPNRFICKGSDGLGITGLEAIAAPAGLSRSILYRNLLYLVLPTLKKRFVKLTNKRNFCIPLSSGIISWLPGLIWGLGDSDGLSVLFPLPCDVSWEAWRDWSIKPIIDLKIRLETSMEKCNFRTPNEGNIGFKRSQHAFEKMQKEKHIFRTLTKSDEKASPRISKCTALL